jgi:hypothetical protein
MARVIHQILVGPVAGTGCIQSGAGESTINLNAN